MMQCMKCVCLNLKFPPHILVKQRDEKEFLLMEAKKRQIRLLFHMHCLAIHPDVVSLEYVIELEW
jgi:hypothetical protein